MDAERKQGFAATGLDYRSNLLWVWIWFRNGFDESASGFSQFDVLIDFYFFHLILIIKDWIFIIW